MRTALLLGTLTCLALTGCSSSSFEECPPEASCESPGQAAVRTPAEPSALEDGFELDEREFALGRIEQGRKRVRVGVATGGCTNYSHASAFEQDGKVRITVLVSQPKNNDRPCTADIRYGSYDVDLPRVLAPNEEPVGGCVPPPPDPLRGISMCEELQNRALD